jgi:hypothetical protein
MTTRLDDLLRDTIGGLADEARPADLARGALRQARGMRARRRAGVGAAVAATVLAVGAVGSVVLPGDHRVPPAGTRQTASAGPSAAPVMPANGPISVQGSVVVLAAATADGTGTWVYDRRHDRYTRLPYRNVVPAPAGNRVAVVADDRSGLTILDVGTGTTVGVAGHASGPYPPEWSPDGRQLAVLETGRLVVIDAISGASRTVPTDNVHCTDFCFATWHPDQLELGVATPDGLQLYSVADGHTGRLLPVRGGVYGWHAWSPDEHSVVVAGYELRDGERVPQTQVVRVATGEVVGRLPDVDASAVYWVRGDEVAVPHAGAVDLIALDGKIIGQVPLPPAFATGGPVVLAPL